MSATLPAPVNAPAPVSVSETETAPEGRIGVMFDRARPPEELIGFARDLEALGVDELWVVEDLGWGGALVSAATALAVTDRIRVGIGVVPAPLRNPALLAMELATLERLHPGRVLAGIGHGFGAWMAQVGVGVDSPLALLEETFSAVRTLLGGETLTTAGRYVRIDGVSLVHPPATVPPLLAGVLRPKSLALAGRVADGTILPEGTSPQAVTAARRTIAGDGAERGGPGHAVTVLVHVCLEPDPERLAEITAPIRREVAGFLGIEESEAFLAAGPPAEVAARIRSLWAAGTDSVALRPVGADPTATVRATLKALGR